jgi:hypothetical protein
MILIFDGQAEVGELLQNEEISDLIFKFSKDNGISEDPPTN